MTFLHPADMRNVSLYLASAVVVALGGTTLYQHGKIQELGSKITALEATVSKQKSLVGESQKNRETLAKQNQAFMDESAALRDKLATRKKAEAELAAAAVSATPDASPEKKNPFAGMMEKMMKNPKMVDAIAAQQMAVIKPMYADFVKQLKLSPEETQQFYDLLAAEQTTQMQAGLKILSGEEKAGDDVVASSQGMKDFLGSQFSQYETYKKSVPDRMALTQINSQMAARQTPLRPDQSNGLLQIMQQEKLNTAQFTAATTDPKNRNFSEKTISDTYNAMEDRNGRVLTRAKNLLTLEQWNSLAEQQKQTLQMQKMGMEMAKGMFPEK